PDMLLNHAAFRTDDEKGGKRGNAAIGKANLIVGESDGVVDAFGIHDLFDDVRVIVVHHQADDLEAFLVVILEFDEAGDFCAARTAPGSPEVQQDDFALYRGQREILTSQILELKFGSRIGIADEADHGKLGR